MAVTGTTRTAPMVRARDLIKRYGDSTVVDGVSLTVQPGEWPGQLTVHGVDLALAEALAVGQNVRVTGFEGHGSRTRARVEVI